MTLSMVSSVIETLIGEDFAGSGAQDLTTQMIVPLLRILILVATFLLANCTFNKKNHQKHTSPYNQATRSLLIHSNVMKASSKKPNGFKGKRPLKPPCEDEDALSTSVGSSDSESDLTSSDQDEDVKGTKISISELLRRRPSSGVPPPGGLKTMPVGSPVQQRRSCTAWETARGASSAPHTQVASKMATSKAAKAAAPKAAKAAPKAPCQTAPAPVKSRAPVSINASGVDEAKPERIQALLAIICPEEDTKTFPPGLEPSPPVGGG